MHEAVAANHADCALALLEYNPRTIDSFFGSKKSTTSSSVVDLLARDSDTYLDDVRQILRFLARTRPISR